MHIEFLVEDKSGQILIEYLVPKIIGASGTPHTWRVHSYKGIGHLPSDLNAKHDPAKRVLLNNLPRVLKGYARSSGIDAVVVVLDVDNKNCVDFLAELNSLAASCNMPKTLFRLAIEEVEAWYLGDREAINHAFSSFKAHHLNSYAQDSICGTWELLANAIYPGGVAKIKKAGWPLPGQVKCEWAEKIPKHMNIQVNQSPRVQTHKIIVMISEL